MKYSIIITAYNSEKYINRCLDSIINQTKHNFEVIVVDDGSTDNTGKIVKSYRKKYNFIKYFYKENGGTAHSRNFGISKVRTKYFIFVDSDDYILEDLMETIEKYDDYDVLSFKSYKVDDNGKILEKLEKQDFQLIDGQSFLRYSYKNKSWYIVPWSYVYNTEFWKKNKLDYPNYYVLEDTSGTPIVLINAKKMISLDYYGYCYVQTDESTFRTNRDEKINRNTVSYLFHYDYLNSYIENFECSEKFKILFKEFTATMLLWYGSTLPKKHLKKFAKELKERDVVSNLDNIGPHTNLIIKVCKKDYRLYYALRKILELRAHSFSGLLKFILIKIYWFIRIFFTKIYWFCRNTVSKVYWFVRKCFTRLYWICRNSASKIYWPTKKLLSIALIKTYWFCRNSASKVYWFVRKCFTRLYWICRNSASKVYWPVKKLLSIALIKTYWFCRNSASKIYWLTKKGFTKVYWICRNSIGKIYYAIRNMFSTGIQKNKEKKF